jgi:hypothetical protein
MPSSQTGLQNKKRARPQRVNILLVFNPTQKVPNTVQNAILKEWLVPCLVEEFLRERGFVPPVRIGLGGPT